MSLRRIRFQYPGGDLAFWTGLTILGGGFAVWLHLVTGKSPWYLWAVAAMSVPAVGIWLRIRVAGHVFLVVHALLGIMAVVGLFLLPFGWRSLIRPLTHFLTAHSALEWTRVILREDELIAEGIPADQARIIARQEADTED